MAEEKPEQEPVDEPDVQPDAVTDDEAGAETAPMPVSRPVSPVRTRVIRPAGGRRPGPPLVGGGQGSPSSGKAVQAGAERDPDDTMPMTAVDLNEQKAEQRTGVGAEAASRPESSPPVGETAAPQVPEADSSTPSETSDDVEVTTAPGGADDPEATTSSVVGDVPEARPSSSVPDKPVSRFRVTRFQVLAAVLLGALGFGLIVQARQTQSDDLSSLSQSELVRVLDDVSRQSERLDAEARALETTRNELQSGTDRAAAAEKATRERLDVLGILAGTEPAQGPGVSIRIDDPQALVDAATVLDAVQELRDAGAEAIQFGQVRVVAGTSFTDPPTGGAVVADGVTQSPPYRLLAIGDPATMESALNIPGGVLETLHQVGASGTVQRKQDLEVSAVREAAGPAYAVPRTDEPQD
ncbi:DUF881 domain-containing protein [Kineosporia rhizophila]|uniref:DUF881 domain-containing protein n=1 Tax=Kineosporia TaxID=49184 RepID=UPI001E2A6261|nr:MULTISPECIES: DUF881 domain-containing protein [Kineosporia]MCE0539482.1 DUF881 domain-containing protein [Kineosporia rhizophila]GLY18483.1 hypothetical protein Kisp01_54970 [Kineosporia sp. NBRC 101677]